MAAHTWTCQRQTLGVKCKTRNPARKRLCSKCGKRRPDRKRPAHLAVLDELSFEDFAAINGGKFCGICGKTSNGVRAFHRDHDHRNGGRPRGLLCFPCNSALRASMTAEWLRKAADYLDRADK